MSDYIDKIANSKLTDFEDISDITAYDMSSRVRKAEVNEILVLRNKSGYYALIQVLKINKDKNLVTVRYRIISEKLKSTWQPEPEKYISRNKSGKVKFDFSDNNGRFIIGNGEYEFITRWGGRGFRKIYLLDDDIKSIALLNGTKVIKNLSEIQNLAKVNRVADLSVGNRAVLENSNGKFAIIKIIEANTEGYSSDKDEVVFEYEILY